MGIFGLLPMLQSIIVQIGIKDLDGCSVAVDAYGWLHACASCCSRELCKGLPTTRHIKCCMNKVHLLQRNGIKPILVFDGGHLPLKIEKENERKRLRDENLARAKEHELKGNVHAAHNCNQAAVDVTPFMARQLIQVLKKENISYVVAPYEADAQMTFLAITQQVDAVITEDSDLIPFGCPRIIFKMDKFGRGDEFQYSRLPQMKEFAGFTKQMFLEMCILSGCDYLKSLKRIGLVTAHKLIKNHKTYDKVIEYWKSKGNSVPLTYEDSFRKAIWAFQHQRVYDPISQALVHLFDVLNDPNDELELLTPSMPQHIARGIAEGDLDPFTKLPFPSKDVSTVEDLKPSKPKGVKRKHSFPIQKNVITNYFSSTSEREVEAPAELLADGSKSLTSRDGKVDDQPVQQGQQLRHQEVEEASPHRDGP